MINVANIFDLLSALAPLELQMSFDNAGFLVGHKSAEVNKILLALDITDALIDEAIEMGADLIISHHPVIWRAPKRLTDESEKKLLKLIENHIAAICMHTNLDIAEGGVNDVLIELLGAESEGTLDELGCGRYGNMHEAMDFDAFLKHCKLKLNANGLRYYKAQDKVSRLAVMGGAGADSIVDAHNKGCDTYVTADIKYHEFQFAEDLGINLIDADHFSTENPIIPVLANKIKKAYPTLDVSVSKTHRAIIQFA